MRINTKFLESSDGLHPSANRPDNSVVTLAMGILTQAVRDLIRPQTRRERDWKEWREDARSWLESNETEFGSFHWVCSVIKANPPAVRKWVDSLDELSDSEKKSTVQMLLRLTYNGSGSSGVSSSGSREKSASETSNSGKLMRTA